MASSWRKSSYSGDNGNCVEVRPDLSGVAVRDSKKPGPVLNFPNANWQAFTVTARAHR